MSSTPPSRPSTAPMSTQGARGNLAHVPTLDGLRGLAIVLVLAHNLDVLELTPFSSFAAHGFKELLYLGWVGVQLFFVLSGYLITRGLLATNHQPHYFKNFYIKRALRIFPLYYLSLLMLTVVLPHGAPAWFGAPDVRDGWLWVYLSNWTEPLGLGGGERLPHFWSLAVEEQFYLIWPLLLYRRTAWQTLWLSAGVVLVGPLLRWQALSAGYSPEALYEFTICRADALAIGAALAAWEVFRQQSGADQRAPQIQTDDHRLRWATAAWLGGSLLFAFTAIDSRGFQRLEAHSQIWSYSLLALSFALLLWAASRKLDGLTVRALLARQPSAIWFCWPYLGARAWQQFLRTPWLRAFGKYSYAIYVFHKPLHDLLGKPLLLRWTSGQTPDMGVALAYLLIMTAASYALAWISWRVLEKPMLQLKGKLAPPPSTPKTATHTAHPAHEPHLPFGVRASDPGAGSLR